MAITAQEAYSEVSSAALPEATSPRWRIASCINSMEPSGGSELNAVRTAELLQKRGHSVVAVTFTNDMGGMYQRYRQAGIPVFAFPVDSLVGRAAFRQVGAMSRFFRDQKFDLVHTHDSYTNFLMVIAARRAGIPSLASKRYTRHFRPQHRITDWVSFRVASHVLANSEAVMDSVMESERISAARVSVVPNFVDDEVFDSNESRAEWRRQLGIPEGAVVHAIVAQLREEKNHRLLLECFSRLVADNPDAHLIIVGDGPERESIAQYIRASGLSQSVTMTGHVHKAWRCLAAADVALLPSRHEGFPNAVVEAMAVGVPVVASRVGGIPDAVVDGQTGLLVPPGDGPSLLQALQRMHSDTVFRFRCGERARTIAGETFRASTVLGRLESLYASIVVAGT